MCERVPHTNMRRTGLLSLTFAHWPLSTIRTSGRNLPQCLFTTGCVLKNASSTANESPGEN